MIAIINNMDNREGIFLISLLSFLLLVINYSFLDSNVTKFIDEKEFTIVNRVIDGDTIVVDNNTHVRMLGINTPEKGEKYSNEAKVFLEKLVLNKTVELEYGKERKDLYGRTLAYVILNDKNINVEQVKNGFANFYIYNKDVHTIQLEEAWKSCLINNKNLCEKSNDKCSVCVVLKEIKNQTIVFQNNCSFKCNLTNWDIKDEGRKHFNFGNFILDRNVSIIVGNGTNSKDKLFWKGESYVWTAGGDTLFLRDAKGKLVLWKEINR
jgi:hypothetical protein